MTGDSRSLFSSRSQSRFANDTVSPGGSPSPAPFQPFHGEPHHLGSGSDAELTEIGTVCFPVDACSPVQVHRSRVVMPGVVPAGSALGVVGGAVLREGIMAPGVGVGRDKAGTNDPDNNS